MDKKNLFSKIDNASNNAVKAKMSEDMRKMFEVADLYNKALARCGEVAELCEIINYAISRGYAIEGGGGRIIPALKGCPQLLTEGINHQLGFYGASMVRINCIDFSVRYDAIGFMAGGYCGTNDFFITADDVYFGKRNCCKSFSEYNPNYRQFGNDFWSSGVGYLKSFLNGFDDFKARVYDFVENIDKYKCYR